MNTLCGIFVFSLFTAVPALAQVDLHAHLEMKAGVGPILIGSGSEEPQAMHFETRAKSKAALAHLDPRDLLPITVVSLYGHPVLSHPFSFDWKENVRDALDQEFRLVMNYVEKFSTQVGVARNAREARNLMKENKKVLVLSIEGAYGALEREEDFKLWIDERGVAIITPFHLTGDHFGGPALMPNVIAFFNSPTNFMEAILLTGASCLKTFCVSPMGITDDGEVLIRSLMNRKVWVDLAHANDRELDVILPAFERDKLPLLITHTSPRNAYIAERGYSDREIDLIKKIGGSVGLIPSDDMLYGLKSDADCFSGLLAFKDIVKSTIQKIGEARVMFGTDINAPLTGLSPFCKERAALAKNPLELAGFYRYSEVGALWKYVSLKDSWAKSAIEDFLKNWNKIRP